MQRYFLRDGATKYLQEALPPGAIKESTLANLAAAARGPKFKLFSRRALYSQEALDAWIADQTAGVPAKGESTRAAAP